MTRHKSQHAGTVEEAAAATAVALSSRQPVGRPLSHTRSESEYVSGRDSPLSTPSPGQRPVSMSPNMDFGGQGIHHHTEYPYPSNGNTHGVANGVVGGGVGNNMLSSNLNPGHMMTVNTSNTTHHNTSIPAHLRNDILSGSPTSPSSMNMRPTSHPTGYGLPSVMEPNIDAQMSRPGSTTGSPHLSSIGSVGGWQSPSHNSGYIYGDADYSHQYPQRQHRHQPPQLLQHQPQQPDNNNTSHGSNHHHAPHLGLYYGQPGQDRRAPPSTEPGLVHMS